MNSNDDPFAAAEHREMLERRARRDREWLHSPFGNFYDTARREVPQQTTADYIRELDARQAAEAAAKDAADRRAADAAAEIDLHLPKPFTS